MWEPLRHLLRRPPSLVRPLWRWWLLRVTGRLLRRAGVSRLVCYDIGARWGIWSGFRHLPLPIYRVGFEADPAEAERLVQNGAFDAVIPAGVSGEGGPKTLYLGTQSGCSSIYGPDLDVAVKHCETHDFIVVREIPLETKTLADAIAEYKVPLPDFLKLDVEGAELEILRGSRSVVEQCSGIFFEARLARIYHGEGLFGGVSTELLDRGFSITTFDPVGSFEGAIMLVDASACRNVRTETNQQRLLKSAAFAFVVGNFEYGIACLRRVASKREILLG